MSQNDYINSFALISFNIGNAQKSLKYEYFNRPSDVVSGQTENNSIEFDRLKPEHIDDSSQPIQSFWVAAHDDDFEIVAKSGLTNPDEISGMMAGPFSSHVEAEIFIDNINSYSLQF